jgi:hypothetical protein
MSQHPAAENADALRIAEAVRHIKIGLSSFAELTLGAALLLYGLAITLSDIYPSGWDGRRWQSGADGSCSGCSWLMTGSPR